MRKAVILLVLVPVLVLASSIVALGATTSTIPDDLAEHIADANQAISNAIAGALDAAADVDTSDPVKADKEYAKIAEKLKETTDKIIEKITKEAAKYGVTLEFCEIPVQIGPYLVIVDPIHVAGD